jgi:hypothetical protein
MRGPPRALADPAALSANVLVRAVPQIPGNPYRGADAPTRAYVHLQLFHGIERLTATQRLHRIKQRSGLGATDNVVIGRTGDVYHEMSGEHLGSLTDPAA